MGGEDARALCQVLKQVSRLKGMGGRGEEEGVLAVFPRNTKLLAWRLRCRGPDMARCSLPTVGLLKLKPAQTSGGTNKEKIHESRFSDFAGSPWSLSPPFFAIPFAPVRAISRNPCPFTLSRVSVLDLTLTVVLFPAPSPSSPSSRSRSFFLLPSPSPLPLPLDPRYDNKNTFLAEIFMPDYF